MTKLDYEWINPTQLEITIDINKNPVGLIAHETLSYINKEDFKIMMKAFEYEIEDINCFDELDRMLQSFLKDLKAVDTLGFYKEKYKEV